MPPRCRRLTDPRLGKAAAFIDATPGFEMDLPGNEAFRWADLEPASSPSHP